MPPCPNSDVAQRSQCQLLVYGWEVNLKVSTFVTTSSSSKKDVLLSPYDQEQVQDVHLPWPLVLSIILEALVTVIRQGKASKCEWKSTVCSWHHFACSKFYGIHKKLLELIINEFSMIAGYRIRIQKNQPNFYSTGKNNNSDNSLVFNSIFFSFSFSYDISANNSLSLLNFHI